MSLLIVSGLSGSGKSIALQALEDLGYYCIDNLPASLLPHFTEQLLGSQDGAPTNTAVGIDARNRAFLDVLPQSLARLEQLSVKYRILFLEADENVLVKRFKETRRRHPLTDKHTPLLEGIRLERKLLEPLSFNPALRIDTTHTTPHELRTRIQDFAGGDDTSGMTLLFESFGPYTGREPQVAAFLERHTEVQQMLDNLCELLERWLPGFEAERRSYMTIAVGCTGGQHRSVYLVEKLAAYFAGKGVKTQIRHRELT
jgi:UPF0042 nucleotide-binding protein